MSNYFDVVADIVSMVVVVVVLVVVAVFGSVRSISKPNGGFITNVVCGLSASEAEGQRRPVCSLGLLVHLCLHCVALMQDDIGW